MAKRTLGKVYLTNFWEYWLAFHNGWLESREDQLSKRPMANYYHKSNVEVS